MADAHVLVLAAGGSRRMRGRDKLLQRVDGRPLVARQVAIAQETRRPVTVALPPPPHPRWAALHGSGAETLAVADAAEGMGRTIAAGVAALGDAPAILLLLGDLPDLTAADLRAVLEAPRAPDQIARGATEGGEPGHPILFPPAAYPDLMALRGDDGGRGAVARHSVTLIPLPGRRARADLDTPEAWAAWRAQAGRRAR